MHHLLNEYTWQDILEGELEGVHGIGHWLKVATTAALLAEIEGGDVDVAFLFGIYHDCRRENDYFDPKHGERASLLVLKHYRAGMLKLDEGQLDALLYACLHHTSGEVSDDVTISCCWDADRLDLPRVGTQTLPRFLGTETAKKMASMQEGIFGGTRDRT